MASNWVTIPAKDFCTSVRDGTHDSPKPVTNGRFLVTSRHIIGGRVDLANAYLISQDDFDAINKRSKVDKWDVLVSMIGTVGEACLIKEEPQFAIKNIGLFKTNSELKGKWLYYYLRSPKTQRLIQTLARGTTQAYIPLGTLRDLPVTAPKDIDELREIIKILNALDEKIELNRKMNETLEVMAKAVFKSWFVDFEPVRAKAEGRDPGVPKEIASLFPDEFEDSEIGEIPKGWRIGPLNEVLILQRGFDLPTSKRTPGQFPVIAASGPNGSHNKFIIAVLYCLPSPREKTDLEKNGIEPHNRSFSFCLFFPFGFPIHIQNFNSLGISIQNPQ